MTVTSSLVLCCTFSSVFPSVVGLMVSVASSASTLSISDVALMGVGVLVSGFSVGVGAVVGDGCVVLASSGTVVLSEVFSVDGVGEGPRLKIILNYFVKMTFPDMFL